MLRDVIDSIHYRLVSWCLLHRWEVPKSPYKRPTRGGSNLYDIRRILVKSNI